MRSILAFAVLLVAISATTGCHKIYYHNGGPPVANKDSAMVSEWHHIGILGLVEFSDPVNIGRYCPKGWDTVETENSFLTGLVSVVVPYGLYTPRRANVVCRGTPGA